MGTAVHKFAEWAATDISKAMQNFDAWPKDDYPFLYDVTGYLTAIKKFFQENQRFRRVLIPEVQICLPEHKIAGTVDLLGGTGNRPFILDWKTSKSIDFISSRHMKAPVSDLYDSNFNQYALQLSMYAHILNTRYNVPKMDLMIVWLNGRGGYTIYEILELKEHVHDILG